MIAKPAILISTGHTWKDIRWNKVTVPGLEAMRQFSGTPPSKTNPKVKGTSLPYRFLFDGNDTHLKWIAAALVAKDTNKPIYRIDLSALVSAYIGETEKNISQIFAKAESRDFVLFFDEADALFGTRSTPVSKEKEEHGILQALESFPGTIIFSAKQKSNLDHAFLRRMQISVTFPAAK